MFTPLHFILLLKVCKGGQKAGSLGVEGDTQSEPNLESAFLEVQLRLHSCTSREESSCAYSESCGGISLQEWVSFLDFRLFTKEFGLSM